MDCWDVVLVKFPAGAFAFFLITIWPVAMKWVSSVNPWYFLIACIILGIIPLYRFWAK